MVCCHKPCQLPHDPDEIFLPIQVGAAISSFDLGMQRDDQVDEQPCNNISAKNKSYCELTAIYWAWKNIKKLYPNLEYIGLNHYRRYFDFDTKKNVRIVYKKESCIKDITIENLQSLLKKDTWILPKCNILRETLKVQYCVSHNSEDFRLTKQAVEELYPEYKNAFRNTFESGVKFYQFNMFIMPISDFFSYCRWLFDILEYVEQRSIYKQYDDYQKRIFGFLSERLFSVYIYKKSKNKKEVPVIFFDSEIKKKYEKNDYFNKILYIKKKINNKIREFSNKPHNLTNNTHKRKEQL